jgi:AcrR family transcriptional regulator
MTKSNSPKRKYDSTRRQAQADETRREILAAARKLFMNRGYAGATIEAIATEAKVAPETVYAVFRNKKRILINLMNISSPGSAEDAIPMPERAVPQAVSKERDQHRQIQMFAEFVADNLDQVARVSEIMVNAAQTDRDFDQPRSFPPADARPRLVKRKICTLAGGYSDKSIIAINKITDKGNSSQMLQSSHANSRSVSAGDGVVLMMRFGSGQVPCWKRSI